jgi:hypothetical protein
MIVVSRISDGLGRRRRPPPIKVLDGLPALRPIFAPISLLGRRVERVPDIPESWVSRFLALYLTSKV